jgi:hypothetical protein
MSTVQSLLDNLAFRVDTQADLYHLINLAVRTIAKRLYFHDSDILRSEFSLPLYAEQSYSASTIAFVASNPPTITDSAAQFVVEGFKSGMLVGSDQTNNLGPFTIDTVTAGTLTLKTTDTLIPAGSGSAVILTSRADVVNLPSDFWGFCGDSRDDFPHIDGYTDTLRPLPNKKASLYPDSSSSPDYFKLKGSKLYLYPKAGEDIIIKGDYFARPTQLTALSDIIPYDELFDDAICETIAMFYGKDLTTQAENVTLLQKTIFEAVDMIVPKHDQKAPVMAGGMDFESFV